MSVNALPAQELLDIRKLQADISSLYAIVSKDYKNEWEEEWMSQCKNKTYTECPKVVTMVENSLIKLQIRDKCKVIPVESDYYNWELQQRAFRVNAPSEKHMCKSVIIENTRCTHDKISDPLYSRYYCVITQYITPVNTQKLLNFCRGLKNKTISKKYYNFRLADPQVSLELTGFEKGGVSPIGMKESIPVIMSKSILNLEPAVIYLGAGHIDWKLGIPASAFREATNCFVTDLD